MASTQSDRERFDRVANAVEQAALAVTGERPAVRGAEFGVRHEFTVPGARITVEAIPRA